MPNLTVTGDAITDAVRSAGTQGDGRASPDSSYGIHEATTNKVTNGGFETNTTGWADTGAGSTLTRTTAHSKFGVASCEVDTPGLGAGEGMRQSASVTGVATGETWTASAWVKASAGQSYRVSLEERNNLDVIQRTTDGTAVAADGTFKRVTVTATLGADTDRLRVKVTVSGTADVVFRVDGAQLEQQPLATPYVETDGAEASRTAAAVTGPASVLNSSQMWFAARVRMGFTSGAPGATNPGFFAWSKDGNNILKAFVHGASLLRIQRSGSGSHATLDTALAFSPGDFVTVIGQWTATQIKLSVNGGAFTSDASTAIPSMGATTFTIGSDGATRELGSDFMWFTIGTGALTDADPATINGFGNTDKTASDFPASPTMFWAADTAAYEERLGGESSPDAFYYFFA